MPPHVSFPKDAILNEAFEIVRKEGLQALTARKIAQHLKSSTQPIYRVFRSMKELETAVIEKAKAYAVNYLLAGGETQWPFLNMGLRYLRFAKEEKELFTLVYLSGRIRFDVEHLNYPFNLFLERMKQDPSLQGLDDASLNRLTRNMWIFTHGMTTLFSTDSSQHSDDFMHACLRQMGKIVIEWEHYNQHRNAEQQNALQEGVS
jgi:AcrR family transcriptional regulator